MMRLKKLLLFIVCTFLYTSVFSQVEYNPMIKRRYDEAFEKLDPRLKKLLDESSAKLKGAAIVLGYNLDTLNRPEFKNEALPVLSKAGGGYTPEKVLTPDMMIGRAKLSKDTLKIVFVPWFMPGDEIQLIIKKNDVSPVLQVWNNEDKVYSTLDGKKNTGFLSIPASAKLVLSDQDFKAGNVIYGSLEFITDEYFKLYDERFTSQKAKLKLSMNGFFKLTVLKDDGY